MDQTFTIKLTYSGYSGWYLEFIENYNRVLDVKFLKMYVKSDSVKNWAYMTLMGATLRYDRELWHVARVDQDTYQIAPKIAIMETVNNAFKKEM